MHASSHISRPADLRAHSFAPVWRADARLLILGSLPGRDSLAAGQYYAHPRNQFWPVLGGLLGFAPGLVYGERLRALRDHGIALWDVAATGERSGSLDSAIRSDSVQPNALPELVTGMPELQAIGCNGQTAAKLLRQHFPALARAWPLRVLPSTSPALAALPLMAKRDAWRSLLLAAGIAVCRSDTPASF